MNKLISGAKFSVRAAREQHLRLRRTGLSQPGEPQNLLNPNDWGPVAQGFIKNDPTGTKVARLLAKVRKVPQEPNDP